MMPKKKLIEVALPLPEINDASAYDKMPGIGRIPRGFITGGHGCRCRPRGPFSLLP